jgi:hypothetical protein
MLLVTCLSKRWGGHGWAPRAGRDEASPVAQGGPLVPGRLVEGCVAAGDDIREAGVARPPSAPRSPKRQAGHGRVEEPLQNCARAQQL